MPWTENDVPNQTGRVAIVTGANSGIGYETARVLAVKGAHIVLACRSEERGRQAVDMLKAETPDAQVDLSLLDLSSLASVSDFVVRFRRTHSQLDLLINNAGVMVPPFGKTAEGFELQFGTNHIGHFALTAQLIDLLNATSSARIVNVSSVAHKFGKMNFENLNAEKGYSAMGAYAQSKLANLLFGYELQRRLQGAGHSTLVTAAHPGWTATNLQVNAGFVRVLNPIFAMKPLGGALPTLRAATDPAATPGAYYGPGGFMEWSGAPKTVSSSKRSHDEATAAKLWAVSEQLSKVSFELVTASAA